MQATNGSDLWVAPYDVLDDKQLDAQEVLYGVHQSYETAQNILKLDTQIFDSEAALTSTIFTQAQRLIVTSTH